MLARTPADPFFEGVAEDEGILVADLMGDGLDLQAGGGEQLGGLPHAQPGDVMHGRAAEGFPAQAAQVLGADVRLPGELVEGPVVADVRSDFFPDAVQAVIDLPGLGETLDVMLHEFHPMKHGGGLGVVAGLLDEAFDGVPKRFSIKRRHQRRAAAEDGLLLRLLLVTHPAAAPGLAGNGMEGVHHEGRQRHGQARAAFLPRAIDKDASLSLQAGEEIQATLVHAHDAVGRARRHDTRVGDAVLRQRAADRRAAQPGTRVPLRGPHHTELRARTVRVRFR